MLHEYVFLFERRNIEISETDVCELIIMHAFDNPLWYGFGYFPNLFQFFPGNLKKKTILNLKNEKIVGEIRGENTGAAANFFYKALPPKENMRRGPWLYVPVSLIKTDEYYIYCLFKSFSSLSCFAWHFSIFFLFKTREWFGPKILTSSVCWISAVINLHALVPVRR